MPNLHSWIGLAIGTAVLSIAGSSTALACRCSEPGPQAAYRSANTVVHAKVLSVTKENDGDGIAYVVEVRESWKQPVPSQIAVHTGTTCSFDAEVGATYVLFLRQDTPAVYETAKCMGNRPEASSRELLKFLRAKTSPDYRGSPSTARSNSSR